MDVGVDEAGRHGPIAKVDHPGPRPDEVGDDRVVTDGDDPPAGYSHGPGDASPGIHRDDPSVTQHEVGGAIGGSGGHDPSMTARPMHARLIPTGATDGQAPDRP